MQNISKGKSSRFLSALFLFLLILNSCKKPDTVGLEVLPPDDRLQGEHTDTITVIAYTVEEDSLLTSKPSFHILGTHNDPVFGLSSSSFYSQFILESVNPDFGPNAQVDSVVLSLAYAGYYADIMKLGGVQSFSVHRVTEDLRDSMYSNEVLDYQKIPLGTYEGLIDTRDSVLIDTINLPPQMRIKLNNSFGNELLSSQSIMSGDSLFLQQFKGLYITPSTENILSGMGSLIYIDPRSGYTKLTMYYHNDTTSGDFDFKIDPTTTRRFNHFDHTYSDVPDIAAQLTDSTLGAEKLYLQSMAGLKAKITFPYLNNFLANGQKIAVNKAQLIFPVTAGTTSRLSPPARVIVLKMGTDGKEKLLNDYIYESADFFGGYYNSTEKEYSFNIPRHIQGLLTDTTADKTIYLRVTGAGATANRCVINGTQNPNKPLKLKLTYTILE